MEKKSEAELVYLCLQSLNRIYRIKGLPEIKTLQEAYCIPISK